MDIPKTEQQIGYGQVPIQGQQYVQMQPQAGYVQMQPQAGYVQMQPQAGYVQMQPQNAVAYAVPVVQQQQYNPNQKY